MEGVAKEFAEKSLNVSIKNNEKAAKGPCKVLLGYLSYKVDPVQKPHSLELLEQGMNDEENFKQRWDTFIRQSFIKTAENR